MNTKILVCCHKQAEIPFDENFLPIHCGKKLSEENLGMIGDDTGDNISELNPYFCELTAQYWAWKNLKDVDVIGLCHYRRFFRLSGGVGRTYRQTSVGHKDIDTSLIPKLLDGHDVILPKPVITHKAMYDLFAPNVTGMQIQIFIRVLARMHPEYKETMVSYLNGNRYVGCNMGIMPWELFCKYNEFLFPVLFKTKEYMKPMPYSYYNRALGMFSEILLPVFCKFNHLKVKSVPIILLTENSSANSRMKPIFPKCLKVMFDDGIRSIQYFVSNKRTNDTYLSPFWEAYLSKDGIII